MSKQYQVIIVPTFFNMMEQTVLTVTANSEREAIAILAQGRSIMGANGELKITKGQTGSITHNAFWVRKAAGVGMGEKWLIVEVIEAPVAEVIEAPVAEVIEAPVAEVVEVEVIEAEAHTVTMSIEEKRAAWDIFVKEWAKSRAAYIRGEAEAPARIVEDVDASYDDDAIDEALDAIRDAIISGRSYAHLIETAQDLGATRHAISEVITDAKHEATA